MPSDPSALRQPPKTILQRLSPLAIMGLVSLPLPFVVHWLGLDRLSVQTCGFRAATGFACPSCGTTRAWGSLGHGDFIGAFAYNPVFTAAWFFVVALFIAEISGVATGASWSALWPQPGWRRRVVVALLVALLALNWAYLIADGR